MHCKTDVWVTHVTFHSDDVKFLGFSVIGWTNEPISNTFQCSGTNIFVLLQARSSMPREYRTELKESVCISKVNEILG